MNEFNGSYAGIVENVSDPERLGRVKARVPHVHGVHGGVSGFIPTDALAWALPYGMPAGVSDESGGLSWLPQVGDQVLVQFLDGEPEQPVWTWFMQTRAAAKKLKLHHYSTQSKGDVGPPDRAILSRFGHSLEMTAATVTVTTSQGYQVRLEDSTGETGGSAAVQTPAGQRITLNDLGKTVVIQALDSAVLSAGSVILNAASDMMVRASGSLSLAVGGVSVIIDGNTVTVTTGTGASVLVDDQGNVAVLSATGAALAVETDGVQATAPDGTGMVIKNGKLSVSARQTVLDTAALAVGTDAKYQVFMLTPQALQFFLSHTHTNGNMGSPTGPPIPTDPTFPNNSGSSRMRLT